MTDYVVVVGTLLDAQLSDWQSCPLVKQPFAPVVALLWPLGSKLTNNACGCCREAVLISWWVGLIFLISFEHDVSGDLKSMNKLFLQVILANESSEVLITKRKIRCHNIDFCRFEKCVLYTVNHC